MHIIGVDEAGRGPLAGPVVAAAVMFKLEDKILEVKDSKMLSAQKREYLYDLILKRAQAVGIGMASVDEIDQINILQASLLAMKRAVEDLNLNNLNNLNYLLGPIEVLVDGNKLPCWAYDSRAIIQGDKKILEISAASIVAKVTRDRLMLDLNNRYPAYGFSKHMGYPTKYHVEKLAEHGPCEVHRKSFGPVKIRC